LVPFFLYLLLIALPILPSQPEYRVGCSPCMSAFSNALPAHQTLTHPPDSKLLEYQERRDLTAQDCTNTTPPKSKSFASAVGKIWTAFKVPRRALARHLNVNKRLRRLMPRRTKDPVIPLDKPESSPGAVDDAFCAAPQNLSTALDQETELEPLTCPNPRFAATTATESSISLSSQPETTPILTPNLDTHRSVNLINVAQHESGSDGRSDTPFSEATTLENSTVVNDASSSRNSEALHPSALELNSDPAIGNRPATPPLLSSLIIRPFTPCLQTNLGHLDVPLSDDEDSSSTVRRGGSSPASAVDFHGMGGHFEESPSH
jgi:hypothetical protein